MFFLQAFARLLFVASGLGGYRVSADRELIQSYNYQIIESESTLSNVPKNRPVGYTATFTNLWTSDRHPYEFPSSNAHWSKIVYASHSGAYSMWCADCIASDGVEFIAEQGGTSTLINELSAKQPTEVLDQKVAPGSTNPVGLGDASSLGGKLCVDGDHPLVSAISMIAPSPDWFSGLYDLRLWNTSSKGKDVWYDKFQAYVFPWDAGTEEGNAYRFNNAATEPKEGMTPFVAGTSSNAVFVSENEDSTNGLQVLPIGTITFELQGSTNKCIRMSRDSAQSIQDDSTETFKVRQYRKRVISTTCKDFATRKPHRRCRKKVLNENDNPTGTFVRDFCPKTCAST